MRMSAIAAMGALLCGYFFSYYGWVRKNEGVYEGKPLYSLNYDRIRERGLARFVERIHWPLQQIDSRFAVRLCVYDTSGPHSVPDFSDAPDFSLAPSSPATQPAERDGGNTPAPSR